MKRNLPPLNSLKAFEAAMRHMSFTKAAEELYVTQGAISKQVKLLEEQLGVTLFKRFPKQLIATDEAKIYYTNIASALDSIDVATNLICGKKTQSNTFIIDILPSLSMYWLIPHIKDFKDKHPDLDVHIVTGNGFTIDFASLNADVAIRSNDTLFPAVENERLMGEKMLLLCSPALIDSSNFKLEDIQSHTLLEHTGRPYTWKDWMQSVDLPYDRTKNMLTFEHFFMIIEAAVQGLGFALIPHFLAEGEIRKGRLINPLNIEYETNYSYYLLYPKQNRKLEKVRVFNNWLKEAIPT